MGKKIKNRKSRKRTKNKRESTNTEKKKDSKSKSQSISHKRNNSLKIFPNKEHTSTVEGVKSLRSALKLEHAPSVVIPKVYTSFYNRIKAYVFSCAKISSSFGSGEGRKARS